MLPKQNQISDRRNHEAQNIKHLNGESMFAGSNAHRTKSKKPLDPSRDFCVQRRMTRSLETDK